jgi:hypothetical protein
MLVQEWLHKREEELNCRSHWTLVLSSLVTSKFSSHEKS